MAERKLRHVIGLITPNLSTQANDEVLDMLATRFQARGYQLLITLSNDDIEQEKALYQSLKSITDCIISISVAESYLEIEKSLPKNIPVIFLYNRPEGCPRTCVLENDYSAIYQGLISCYNRGAAKVAVLCTNRNLSATRECLHAYRNAMQTTEYGYNDSFVIDTLEEGNEARTLVKKALSLGCDALYCTTHQLTASVVDYLIFYNQNPAHKPIILLGSGKVDSLLSSQMHIDLIAHPGDQLAEITLQQALYLINHPKSKSEREFRVKGTLQMHTFNGLNLLDD